MSVGSVGNVARVIAVLAACVAAAGSATSSSSANQQDPAFGASEPGPPPPQQMEASRALGLWRSTFGAVKIEADNSHGGIGAGAVQGVWVYQRQGEEVVGYFSGSLRGNVLQFRWQEPNDPPLTGEGYLVFDAQGRQYNGRWWSDKRDRVGDWNGWRPSGRQRAPQPQPGLGDPGAPDGQYGPDGADGQDAQDDGQDPRYAPPPPPRRDAYRRGQPYQPPQQPPYQQAPYQPQPQQQPYPPPPPQQPYR